MERLRSALVTADQRMVWSLLPLLERMGMPGSSHSSAERALDALRRTGCDLLVVDHPLPEMMGLLSAVRSLPGGCKLAVAMAGNARALEQLRGAAADLVCERSYHADVLASVLRRAKSLITGEQRDHPRTAVEKLTYVRYSYDGVRYCEGVMVDLSAGGLCIEALEGLQAGRCLQVAFTLPASNTPIQAVGEITWRDHAGRAGIRFTQIAAMSLRQIERWLEAANRPFGSTIGLMPARAAAGSGSR